MIFFKHKWIAIICLLICSYTFQAFGCRYTVRDVGFVDLGVQSYHLYICFQDDTPADWIEKTERTCQSTLQNSNIVVEMINIDHQENNSLRGIISNLNLSSFPVAVLVSPENRSLRIPLTDPQKKFEEIISVNIKNIVVSPVRKEILQSIIKEFCVILFLHGKDSFENEMTRMLVSEIQESYPKPIKIVNIFQDVLVQEKILLWSIGLEVDHIDVPHVAVLYGRGRRIGPGLKGKAITKGALSSILYVLESDCECGLDKSWMMGTLLPLRWKKENQQEVVKMLGFDAENPFAKMEVSRILGVEASAISARSIAQQYLSDKDSLSGTPDEVNTQKASTDISNSNYQLLLYTVIFMACVILIAGVIIIRRSGKKLA